MISVKRRINNLYSEELCSDDIEYTPEQLLKKSNVRQIKIVLHVCFYKDLIFCKIAGRNNVKL
jgi:hypothetical protein